MLRHPLRVLVVLLLAVAAGLTSTLPAHAARSKSSPQLQVNGPAGEGWAAVGDSVRIAAAGLDATRPASLYKGQWTESGGFTGWNYLYYKSVNVSAAGTALIEEVQAHPGAFRYQICQYYEGQAKNYWVCSPYVPLEVR